MVRVNHRPLANRTFLVSVADPEEAEAYARALARLGAKVAVDPPADAETSIEELSPLRSLCRLQPEVALTPTWLADQEYYRSAALEAQVSPLYRPLGGADGVPSMRSLVITLAGFRGHGRWHAKLMVTTCGAALLNELWPGRTTHLVCAAETAPCRPRCERKAQPAAA